jgi:hypothetical protein
MKQLTKVQKEVKGIFESWNNLDNRLSKSIDTNLATTTEIQKDVAKLLSSKRKQSIFCLYMQQMFKIDKKVTGRLQNCINKPATQRYIFKTPSDKPLTQAFRVRTASKELHNYKLGGKPIVNQAMIDMKGVYHAFKWDIPEKKKPTQISKTQAVVNEFSITKEQYLANAESGKIKFASAG